MTEPKLDLKAIESADKARTPGEWPAEFGRCESPEEGPGAWGPVVRGDDPDEEDRQAQADQDWLRLMSVQTPFMLARIRYLENQASMNRSHTTAFQEAQCRIEELEAENQQLRDQVARLMSGLVKPEDGLA
jgi:hypothetical protein